MGINSKSVNSKADDSKSDLQYSSDESLVFDDELIFMEDDVKKKTSTTLLLTEFMENKFIFGFMMLITIFTLFGDDIRLLALPRSVDLGFSIMNFICMILFLIELTINSIIQDGYKFRFFFWLDIIATASLLLDIYWLMDPIYTALGMDTGGSVSGGAAARAGRASRAGTKAGRIVRLVRLIRLVRLSSITAKCSRHELSEEELQEKLEEERKAKESAAKSTEQINRIEASKLGKMLSDQTIRRVILGVLVVQFVLPNLSSQITDEAPARALENAFYFGGSSSQCADGSSDFSCGLGGLFDATSPPSTSAIWVTQAGWDQIAWTVVTSSYSYTNALLWSGDQIDTNSISKPCLWMRIPDYASNGKITDFYSLSTIFGNWEGDTRCGGSDLPDECPWREAETDLIEYYPPECADHAACKDNVIYARYSRKSLSEQESSMSIITTCFVIVLLCVGSVMFSKDTQTLVIAPIEKMVNIVKQLADDPLNRPQVSPVDTDIDPMSAGGGGDSLDASTAIRSRDKSGQLETAMLETTILKIGSLLQIGFGEAGAQIIGNNMANAEGSLQYTGAGRKVLAVYGFAEVSDFSDLTDCLQEEVMVFVNKIAKIVHSCVHAWGGAANKNIGSAFLLVWLIHPASAQQEILGDLLGEYERRRTALILDERERQRAAGNSASPYNANGENGSVRNRRRPSMNDRRMSAVSARSGLGGVMNASGLDGRRDSFSQFSALMAAPGGGNAPNPAGSDRGGRKNSIARSIQNGGMNNSMFGRELSGNPNSLHQAATYLSTLMNERTREVRKSILDGTSHLFHNLQTLEDDENLALELLSDHPDLREEFISCSGELKRRRQEQADRALLSFLKVIAEIRRAPDLAAYASHPHINKKYKAMANDSALNALPGQAAVPESKFQISMAFGLHVGWSIEGAIGSEYKIDASYLSLHVNTASRLQSACKKYNVRMLLSESFFNSLSSTARNLCRHIDDVKLKGMETKISIFTVDVCESKIQLQGSSTGTAGNSGDGGVASSSHVMAYPIPIDGTHTVETLAAKGTEAVLQFDADVHLMTSDFVKATEYRAKWNEAMSAYLSREWEKAYRACEVVEMMHPYVQDGVVDGPARALKNFILEHNRRCPDDWEGFREMSSK